MLFFQAGEVFEDYAEDNSRKSINTLMDIRPDKAVVLRPSTGSSNGEAVEVTVSPDDVRVGETIIVRPGEKIPLDGEVIEGRSSLNTVALTGESMPRDVRVKDQVISGCVNESGS